MINETLMGLIPIIVLVLFLAIFFGSDLCKKCGKYRYLTIIHIGKCKGDKQCLK